MKTLNLDRMPILPPPPPMKSLPLGPIEKTTIFQDCNDQMGVVFMMFHWVKYAYKLFHGIEGMTDTSASVMFTPSRAVMLEPD